MRTVNRQIRGVKLAGRFSTMGLAVSFVIAALGCVASANGTLDPIPILELAIGDTARVVDYDNGIYVVGTSGGDLYVVNEVGEYSVTPLGASQINDVRIEGDSIAVAAYRTVIELRLDGLTPVELWRTSLSDWREVVSADLSADGSYVCYLARRYSSYTNAGEVGVLGGTDGSLISKLYTSGWYRTNFWIDATADMEYIAASHPTYPPYYRVGVGLYRFDGSTLTFEWWARGVDRYEVTEVKISENKDFVAFGTSSGTWMKMLQLSDGAVLWAHETPGQEQFAVDGDDGLDYVMGATQDWSPPYPWFIIKNLGTSGYEVIAEGTMDGRVNDLDSNTNASLLAFGSDIGEFILLRRSGDTVETVFDEVIDKFIDSIEIGHVTLLVGGDGFINLYGWNRPPDCSNARPSVPKMWPPRHKFKAVYILDVTDPDGDPVNITITGITSDEPTASDKGSGGAAHAPDASGIGTDTAWLRIERSGNGNGRVYEISFEADDGMGGVCNGTVQVCVPHDLGKGRICVDDGQIYDATQIN